jgi:HlyD family secretion protein
MTSSSSPTPDIGDTIGLTNTRKKSRRLKQGITAVLAAIVVVVIVTAIGRGGRSGAKLYKTEQVRYGDLTVSVTATGTLQPKNKVDVGAELSGTIKKVEVDYNSKVRVGQVLARLDTAKLEATIAQSRASLESAKAKVHQARATVAETKAKLTQYQKVREMSNGKVPSQTEMDAQQAAYDRARADAASYAAAVLQAEGTLKANLTDLSKMTIRSPINGVVLTRSVDPGQTVAASMTTPVLFTLAEDLTKMDLHVNVDEADIGKIAEGQKATFNVAAYPGRTFDAKIIQARYGSSTTSGVVTYETVLRVDNADLALRPGMTAPADIIVKNVKNALLADAASASRRPRRRRRRRNPAARRLAPSPSSPAFGPAHGQGQGLRQEPPEGLGAEGRQARGRPYHGRLHGRKHDRGAGGRPPRRHGRRRGHDHGGQVSALIAFQGGHDLRPGLR